ncbi:MAG: glycosyltransferase [Planctomycetes bacterium]|nr:glycosyltransferase [Planctomycetota bacterium]
MIAYIIPTRNRPERLHQTLEAIGALGSHEAQVVIADNASDSVPILPQRVGEVAVKCIRLDANLGAAARNHAAASADPRCEWFVMLDDDSHPLNLSFLEGLSKQPRDVGAVTADISLGGKRRGREAGGLPEVFVGCGVAIRADVFLSLDGYDASFGYYAEEYDFSARLLQAGLRVVFDPRFAVVHHKVEEGRDFNQIIARLVRNNGWVVQRYAPRAERLERLHETISRYRDIARREEAERGFVAGLMELRRTIRSQPRRPMSAALWARFTGLAAARAAIRSAHADRPFATAALIDEGKNSWAVARALKEVGVRVLPDRDDAEAWVIGTMSPGPMLDSLERRSRASGAFGRRIVAPWRGAEIALSLASLQET